MPGFYWRSFSPSKQGELIDGGIYIQHNIVFMFVTEVKLHTCSVENDNVEHFRLFAPWLRVDKIDTISVSSKKTRFRISI